MFSYYGIIVFNGLLQIDNLLERSTLPEWNFPTPISPNHTDEYVENNLPKQKTDFINGKEM